MKALVTGAGGQVGRALVAAAPEGWSVAALTRAELDIGAAEAVAATVDALAPDVIFNAAAYTAVDKAESEADLAFRINRDGAGHLAKAAAARGARLIHISTDFVFDGRSGLPYLPTDATAPLGVYGASKLAGEAAVAWALPEALILRTAWVYAATGANFLNTMVRLMASRSEIGVVSDQIGAPTSAASVAGALWRLMDLGAAGVWHYTDAGVASWYDFAQAIAEEAVAAGVLATAAKVKPITTADYPTAARRPAYSVLDKTATFALLGEAAPHWRVNLRRELARMKAC
jgi:dTDP-4-dehydrorhamnose reductase